MKLLLTSGGIKNNSIRNALVYMLGKPIEQSTALFIPTAARALVADDQPMELALPSKCALDHPSVPNSTAMTRF